MPNVKKVISVSYTMEGDKWIGDNVIGLLQFVSHESKKAHQQPAIQLCSMTRLECTLPRYFLWFINYVPLLFMAVLIQSPSPFFSIIY